MSYRYGKYRSPLSQPTEKFASWIKTIDTKIFLSFLFPLRISFVILGRRKDSYLKNIRTNSRQTNPTHNFIMFAKKKKKKSCEDLNSRPSFTSRTHQPQDKSCTCYEIFKNMHSGPKIIFLMCI